MTRQNSERLRDILIEYQAEKYPTIPRHLLLAQGFPDVNEKGIKKNIKQFCEAKGFKFLDTDSKAKAQVNIETLNHASGIKRQHVSVSYRKSNIEVGHHDIEISRNNRVWCIEIKAQNKRTKYKDKQSQVQKDFQSKMADKFGNDYYIVRGMDDFFELYDKTIII